MSDGLLTRRQSQIADLVARGFRNNEIAERLHIAPGTVKTHLHTIYDTLGIRTRVQLALYVRTQAGL
jgi:two-component system, NarL family, nitrate/nitrite response regulator NarL